MHLLRAKRQWYSEELQRLYEKISPRVSSLDFVGSSSDIFIGRFHYPQVFTGFLAPSEHDAEADTLSMPEAWYQQQLQIEDIIKARSSLIYSRFTSPVHHAKGKLTATLQEISMAKKPVDIEFFLKKKPQLTIDVDRWSPPIGNPAPLLRAIPQENISVHQQVEHVVQDVDVKAEDALMALHQRELPISSLIRLFSAGLLGMKMQRKLVPSRWSTTAVDSIISNNLLDDIRTYPWIADYLLFKGSYLGNSYFILLLPQQWSFEVLEFELGSEQFWQDYENYDGRKGYADSVTGAYYANRLAVTEYLHQRKKQAGVIFFREINKSIYWAPLGVGILREVSRDAFKKQPDTFTSLQEALLVVQASMKTSLHAIEEKSKLLCERKQQTTLSSFFNR